MGLTVHYDLRYRTNTTRQRSQQEVERVIGRLQRFAKSLSFSYVSDVLVLSSTQEIRAASEGEETNWLAIQSGAWIKDPQSCSVRVVPKRMVGFSVGPGEGCEEANFGLSLYPSAIERNGRKVCTYLTGWSWNSFCKTQYASNPDCGGVENFLKCHVGLIRVLDMAKALGVLREVDDDSGFWEHRDLKRLAWCVGEWNERTAAVFGVLQDQFGSDNVESEITKYPNFEHLEAKGCDD